MVWICVGVRCFVNLLIGICDFLLSVGRKDVGVVLIVCRWMVWK